MPSSIAGMAAMLLGEARWWYSSDAAVRPDLVVVAAPFANLGPGLVQCLEPVLVQALVAEAAVEALDVAVLHGSPGLDQDVPYAVALRPGDEGSAGELRAVVGSHGRWVSTEQRRVVQQTVHVPVSYTHLTLPTSDLV